MRGWPLDFAGRLTSARADWAEAFSRSGLSMAPPALGGSEHESSADPQHARRAMIALLAARAGARRGLCTFLAMDYEVFGFDVEKCFAGTEGLVSGLAQADRDEYWSAPLRVASRSTPPSRAR